MAGKLQQITQETMLDQIEDVLSHGDAKEAPAYTMVLGAGASFGSVPTAKQMLGLPHAGVTHPLCVPVWLHARKPDAPTLSHAECVQNFWARFQARHPALIRPPAVITDKSLIGFEDGLPDADSVAQAYKAVFNQGLSGGLNNSGAARSYLRDITLPANSPVKLNSAHFFLASLLALQRRNTGELGEGAKRQYIGRRHFARTVFTTNFDPLLQTSLQIFQVLYYMTDRPELLATDALQTDDHPAIHLFYAHGNIHRSFLANTDDEIALLADNERNAALLAPYFCQHGVIVLGYSGWDDSLLRALKLAGNFKHNLYWLARGESSLSPEVCDFLRAHPGRHWVNINDGGGFMASLHARLCPGMRNTELLSNPIRPLREQLEQVVLSNVAPEKPDTPANGALPVSASTSPEEFRQQILKLLHDAERRFTDDVADLGPAAAIRKLEHQSDLAYSSNDWVTAARSYTKIVDDSAATSAQKAKAYCRRGYAFAQQGMSAESLADYTRAIDLRDAPPEWVTKALVNRGYTFFEEGKRAEALADYTRAIDLPDAPPEWVANALVNRGVVYNQMGRHAEEVADYARAIGLPGALPQQVALALVNRGLDYNRQRKPAESLADYTRAIDLPGAPPELVSLALDSRGMVLYQQGKYQEAAADYTRAIDLPGASPESVARALIGRGLCCKQTGELVKAREDWQQASQVKDAPPDIIELAKSLLMNNPLPPSPQA